ncbi:MAG: pilus assembly protein TadE [Phenylobacterium sp.]|jgi:Flp pilus assembly protein TadG|nr:pilus assembly protein TadE [Phenylobacterium sp.]
MLRRFGKDERGLAAMEFALIAPVMMLLYYGTAELTVAMMAEQRASHVASVVGDLAAQENTINTAKMNDIFAVGDAIMKPFATSSLQLRVTDVKADAAGVPKVIWSRAQGMDQLGAGTASGFPSGLLAAGDAVIMAEVQYTYDSPIHKALPTALTFHEKFYLRPRRSSEVAWDPN